MKKKLKLSNKELDVLHVFWSTPKALAATDIPKVNPALNVNTVQAVVKSLLKKSYIKVSDIVYHNTVLTRTYEPVLTEEEYMIYQFNSTSLSLDTFISSLVKDETDTECLDKLEALIHEQKVKVSKESD